MHTLVDSFDFYKNEECPTSWDEADFYIFKNRASIANNDSSYYPCIYAKSKSVLYVGFADKPEDMKEFDNLQDAMVYYILTHTQ